MDAFLIALEALLGFLAQVVPTLTSNAAVAQAVSALAKIIPMVVQFAPQFVQDVKNIIGILEANPATLPDQIAQLKAQIPVDDAAFDAVEREAEANDAAADSADSAGS